MAAPTRDMRRIAMAPVCAVSFGHLLSNPNVSDSKPTWPIWTASRRKSELADATQTPELTRAWCASCYAERDGRSQLAGRRGGRAFSLSGHRDGGSADRVVH